MDEGHENVRYEPSHPSLRAIAVGAAIVAAGIALAIAVATWLVPRSGVPANAPNNAKPPAIPQPMLETAPRLREALEGKPGVVVLGYLRCRDLCPTTLVGVTEALAASGLEAGRAYRGVFMSIDPDDGPAELAAARDARIPRHDRDAWRFIAAVPAGDAQRVHPAGFTVVTADGKVARHFSGVRFDPADVRAALEAAARGEASPTLAQRFVMWCSHFDPATGRYSATILAVLRALIVAALAIAVIAWRLR